MSLTEKEYLLFCDESDRRGLYYSNFYGGVRVPGSQLDGVVRRLNQKKSELGLTSEIKWEKVGLGVVDRYAEFVRGFFDEVASARIFMRVMFTQNLHVPLGLSPEQQAESYYLLYYQFLKHGFGLAHLPSHISPPRIRIYLDEIGDTREQVAKFKGFVSGLSDIKTVRNAGGIVLENSAITEVRSHDHIVMQALDVVLGSMTFRLNDKHLVVPIGQTTRGKRTVAKERLYKFILTEVKRVTGKKGFNIGITTAISQWPTGRWTDPYLHWLFVPKQHQVDQTKVKP